MKEANPRIFRSLEKAGGLAEFDTIVAAAVASYGAVRHPSEAKAREFADLVLPVWDRLKPETRRALGASLCHSANVPRGIVEKLLAEPIEIAAPFLLSSPVLTETDRRHLSESRDSRLRRLARGNDAAAPADVEAPPAEPARAETSEPVPSPTPAPRVPTAEVEAPIQPKAEEKPAYRPGMAAEAVREALRRMVQPGRAPVARALRPADLVEAAVEGDTAATLAALASIAHLDEATLALVADDESGERLAVALKAIGMRDADAMTVMMMLKPKIGLDVPAFDVMTRYYRCLKRDDCAALLGLRRQVEAPKLEPIFDDIERLNRPAPRAAFGRRTERPEVRRNDQQSRNG
ncbi:MULTISPECIES: DUF2336 domain-containing protein [unclassified Aureimonas]|uniref:DUF2336 domain-containing protein n=1 Tax=unclassified Aureimonas TaxID=2615206 RepID=UPI0006F7F8B8|nr:MULTISPECIES: DUF2336 domain-containing protein [unclassified Aureimonas]KQT55259.1 hypothetical protein ASG62_10515 [Aureimonas sp. Leaf427]KQT71050.1 hypothetical protein ASG54_20900 [Aureimonas sp. Leaf460]